MRKIEGLLWLVLPLVSAILAGVALHNDKLDWALALSLVTLWISKLSAKMFQGLASYARRESRGASRTSVFIPYKQA